VMEMLAQDNSPRPQDAYMMVRGGREVSVPLDQLTPDELTQVVDALFRQADAKAREAGALRERARKKFGRK